MSARHECTRFAWPLLCVWLSQPVAAAERRDEIPGFPVGVEAVTVDVVVTGADGRPVVGLGKDDFRVLEDGRPQTVTSFEAVELPPSPAAVPPPRPPVSSNAIAQLGKARSFAVILDDIHIPPSLTTRARSVVAAFLERNVREGDRVLLAATSGNAWWSAPMEAGRASLLRLVASLEGLRVPEGSTRERMSDYEAIRIVRHHDMDMCRRVLRRFIADGAMPKPGIDELVLSSHCDPTVAMRAQELYDREAHRIRSTLATLTRVMDGMSVAHGRKAVILVSSGFVFDQELEETRDAVAASRRANAAVYFVDVRGLGTGNEQLFQAHHENPDDWGTTDVVQPALSMQLSDDWADAEGAVGLAADTGGFSVRNRNDLTSGMGRIADESRAYYLLGYTPRNAARDGRFRRIEVQVARKDVEVRARKGYYPGGRPADGARPGEPPLAMRRAADAPSEVDGIGLRAAAYVFEERPGDKSRVELVADIELGDIAFEPSEGRQVATVDVLLSVARLEGGKPESFSGTINLRLRPETYERARYYPYRRTLELEAGHYQARLVVHDQRGGAVGSVVHAFDVPSLGEWRVASPVLTDVSEPGSGGQPQPMLVARREFPGAGALSCSVEVYGAVPDRTSGAPRVLLGYTLRRGGEEIARVEAQPLAPGPNGALGGMFGLPLSALAPGGYELALELLDEVSGQRKELREPFTVVAAPPAASDPGTVALTFDDLPAHGSLPPGMTRADVARSILGVLRARQAPPTYGFVSATGLDEGPEGSEVLRLWRADGHPLANHTFSHIDLHANTVEAFERDVLANEPTLQRYMGEGDWRWLRFPYLREGETLEKRRAVAAFLKQRGYRVAHVTLAFPDWSYNEPYARCLAKHDLATIDWMKQSYLRQAAESIASGRRDARLVFGRDIPHVLLQHVGAFDALMLPALLDLLERSGLRLVTLQEAQGDPAYAVDLEQPFASGATFLQQVMAARQIAPPAAPAADDTEAKLAGFCR